MLVGQIPASIRHAFQNNLVGKNWLLIRKLEVGPLSQMQAIKKLSQFAIGVRGNNKKTFLFARGQRLKDHLQHTCLDKQCQCVRLEAL